MENYNFFRLLINRLYYFLFKERFFKKLTIEFPDNVFRWDLIQYIVDKYNFGIAVIRKKPNSTTLKFKKNIVYKNLKFKDYFYNYKNFMNIKSYEKTLKLV